MVSFLCFVLVVLFGQSCAGTSSAYHHRTTSLAELKEIDSYVSSGLPLFDHGFFVSTAQGPILVKQGLEEGSKKNKPRLNPGYYSQLPRLIPAGYEGISISHFNLGSSIPAQSPPSIFAHPSQIYDPQLPPLQQQQQYSPTYSRSPLFAQSQLTQQNAPQPHHHLHQFEPTNSQSTTESRHFIQHPSQRRQDRFIHQQNQDQYQSPVAQGTFQINNFLNGEEETDDHVPTSYQNTMIEHEPFSSRKLIRNPTVEQALDFENTLPENLKNPFYKNEALRQALAQESLPLPGETVVGQWDTTKIQKQRISDLLRSAGFL